MKHTSLLAVLFIIGTVLGLNAQTSSLLLQTGDQVNGTSSNPATISSIGGVSMNDQGAIALQAYVSEMSSTTNAVTVTNYIVTTNYVPWTNYSYSTNYVPWTNYSYSTNYVSFTNTSVTPVTNIVTRTNNFVSYQYTSVSASNFVINFSGTVTNVLYTTNRWNVNGSTNTYVNQMAQIQSSTNSRGAFTNIFYSPQGYHAVTNTFTTNVTQISYQTNYTVTNRLVVTSTPILTNRPVVTSTPILTNRPVVSVSSNSFTTNRVSSSFIYYNGIWASDTNGSVNLLIRSGQSNGESNSTINYFNNPVINNNGAVAFLGYSMVTNPVVTTDGTVTNAISNRASIYLVLQGSTNPITVASVGSPAPGLPDNFTSFGSIVLPDVGGVIFTGWVGTNNGLWVQNPDSSVKLVAFRGQSIPTGSSNKVISSFSLMNKFHSKDTGIITYQAYFTDGTSAAVRVNR